VPFKTRDLIPESKGLLSLMSKDSSFNVINAFQISFNYLCPFKSYLGVLALSKHLYKDLTGQLQITVKRTLAVRYMFSNGASRA